MKMGLYETLATTYQTQAVEPFGECLIVPAKAFRSEWKLELEKEGVKVFAQTYGSQSCFFLRKTVQNKGETPAKAENSQAEPSKKRVRKSWTPEQVAELKKLRAEGHSYKEIAEKMNRSPRGILDKTHKLGFIRNIDVEPKKTGETVSQQPESLTTPTSSTSTETTTSPTTNDDDVVKEIVEALNLLYPRCKVVAKFLLREAGKILEAQA